MRGWWIMDNYNAVIDIGSNSVRLVIYYEDEQGIIYEVDQLKNVVRLSSYMDSRYYIKDEGIARTIEVLKGFRQLCEARKVKKVMGIATAATRKAGNREVFLKKIYQETGFVIQVLSGEQEAYCGYLAVVNSMNIQEGYSIDIGGGSSEIVKIQERNLIHSHSFPFGAVTLTQEFFHGENPTKQEIQSLSDFINNQLSLQDWLSAGNNPLIGIGGTARAVGKIHQKLSRYPLPSLHHYRIWKYEIDMVFQQLLKMSIDKRKSLEGMPRDRADIIIAGIMVLQAVMEKIGAEELIISNKGLRDGMIQGERIDDVIGYGVKRFMSMYRMNDEHAHHVAFLTERLFDELKNLHLFTYGKREKQLLSIASLLHDCGRSINFYESERHTFYLIVHVLLPGLTHRERLLTALIASYTGPKKMRNLLSPYESLLTDADVEMVERLGVLLLIARSLDRSESGAVSYLRLYHRGQHLELTCYGNGRCPLELKVVEEAGKKFKKIYAISMEFQWVTT